MYEHMGRHQLLQLSWIGYKTMKCHAPLDTVLLQEGAQGLAEGNGNGHVHGNGLWP